MEWLRENFFWLVVGALFIWMHLKMHGGHGGGGHGGHGGFGGRQAEGDGEARRDRTGNEGEHHAGH